MINHTTSPSTLKKVLIFLSVTLCYFCLGWGSLKLATINDFSSPMWAPSGLAVGTIFLFGNWLAPAIFLGAFFTNLTVSSAIPELICIGSGNMLEAMLGAYLIHWVSKNNSFKNYTEVLAIVSASALGSVVSASIGICTLLAFGHTAQEKLGNTWFTWWSGDAIGCLIILPLFFEIKKLYKKFFTKNIIKII